MVSEAVKRQLDSESKTVILCEQCSLLRSRESEIEAPREPESNAMEDVEPCPTCATLKEQEESAAKEFARCQGLPDRVTTEIARKKWAHLFNARWAHQFKKHSSVKRGRV